VACKRICQSSKRTLKRLHCLRRRLAACAEIDSNPQAHRILDRRFNGDQGAADDQIGAAATQRNGAEDTAQFSAIGCDCLGLGPLPLASWKQIDVTADGMGGRTGRREC